MGEEVKSTGGWCLRGGKEVSRRSGKRRKVGTCLSEWRGSWRKSRGKKKWERSSLSNEGGRVAKEGGRRRKGEGWIRKKGLEKEGWSVPVSLKHLGNITLLGIFGA